MLEPLPLPWVQRILEKLTVRYGSAFRARYAGVDEQLVWADWAEVLAGLQHRPEAIAHGLGLLPPDHPPTATAFRDLCRAAPAPAFKALPLPPSVVDEDMLQRAKKALSGSASKGKAWAWALARREAERGVRLTMAQRHAWRQALGFDIEIKADDALREFTP